MIVAPELVATFLTGLPGTHGCPLRSKGEIRGGGYRGERRGHRKRGCGCAGDGAGRKKKTEGKNLGAEKYS